MFGRWRWKIVSKPKTSNNYSVDWKESEGGGVRKGRWLVENETPRQGNRRCCLRKKPKQREESLLTFAEPPT